MLTVLEISRSSALKRYITRPYPKSLKSFRTTKNSRNFGYFAEITHKIVKSKYSVNVFIREKSGKLAELDKLTFFLET